MYLDHFQLVEKPFRLTPHLAFRYAERSQSDALTTLLVALREGEGFIKVVGEVGLGKTLLCRVLLDELGPPFITAWIPDPQLSPSSLRTAVARDLGVCLDKRLEPREVTERLQRQLTRMAADGQRPVLLIDEAQALPDVTLESLRLLTNLETERQKLLQVVLFGQPELDRRLDSQRFRQLRQRISYSCRLDPLSRTSAAEYIDHRLRQAGAGQSLFTRAAIGRIARASGGVPRLINILSDKTLLSAYGRGRARADWFDAGRAIRDTESVAGSARRRWLAWHGFAGAGLGAAQILQNLGPGGGL